MPPAIQILRMRNPVAGALDTQTVTVAQSGSIGNRFRGYATSGSLGSISDGTSNVYGGAAITRMREDESTPTFFLDVTGSQPNSGWTTLTNVTDGALLLRVNATYTPGATTTWSWSLGAFGDFFATISGNKTITFT